MPQAHISVIAARAPASQYISEETSRLMREIKVEKASERGEPLCAKSLAFGDGQGGAEMEASK